MAAEMGVELLTEEQYRELQKLGEFDLKTSSWVWTPPDVRALGGALFCDRGRGSLAALEDGSRIKSGTTPFATCWFPTCKVLEIVRNPMTSRTTLSQSLGLLGWLVLVFAAAAIGAVASVDAGAFYSQLARPAWAPPGSVFGPVWSALYLLMGIAAWLVWREQPARGLGLALALFVVQLGVNALWSWLFFAWHNGAWAFVDVGVLLALIVATVAAFWRIRPLAGLLLLPYLAWVGFATALTWAVWRGNPGAL